jgi:hypothetical protein
MSAFALLLGSQASGWVDVFFTAEGNSSCRPRRERELHRLLEQERASQQMWCSSSSAASHGEGATGADAAEGCFRVPPCAGLWAATMLMVWQRKHGCYLALVCEDLDLPLVSATLQLLTIGLSERLGK